MDYTTHFFSSIRHKRLERTNPTFQKHTCLTNCGALTLQMLTTLSACRTFWKSLNFGARDHLTSVKTDLKNKPYEQTRTCTRFLCLPECCSQLGGGWPKVERTEFQVLIARAVVLRFFSGDGMFCCFLKHGGAQPIMNHYFTTGTQPLRIFASFAASSAFIMFAIL